jgi:hypothetical protein
VGARRWEQETQSLTWIVGKVSLLNPRYGSSLEQLRRSSAGQIINAKSITSKVSRGPEQWFVMRLPQEPERHATVAPPFDKDR